MGFLKNARPGRDFRKFSGNITGGIGKGISDIFVSPIGALTGIGTNAFSDLTSSPLLYIAAGGLVLVVLQGMRSTQSVGNSFANNPDSIRAIADAIR